MLVRKSGIIAKNAAVGQKGGALNDWFKAPLFHLRRNSMKQYTVTRD
jgi:hypothetical protein